MVFKTFALAVVSSSLLISLSVQADEKKTSYDTTKLPPAAAKTGVTFDADVLPIFTKSCLQCHGAKTPKPRGKLRLDTRENTLKGGEDGSDVVPNDIANSLLLADVAHLGDPDDYMPPPKNKGHIAALTKDEIGIIRAWIEQGAK